MREGKKCLKIILLFGKYIGNVEINLLTRSIGGFFVAIDRVGLRGRENDCFESVIANSKDTKGINIWLSLDRYPLAVFGIYAEESTDEPANKSIAFR